MQSFVIGEPVDPYSSEIISAVTRVVDAAPNVVEAHMPQLFMPPEVEEPEQVLVVVHSGDINEESIISEVAQIFEEALPEGPNVLIIPVPLNDDFIDSVREAGCEIYNSLGSV